MHKVSPIYRQKLLALTEYSSNALFLKGTD